MKILVVGQGFFGEKILETLIQRGENVIGSFSPPDKGGEAMHVMAERSGVPFFRPNHMKDSQVHETFLKLKPDLVLLAFVTDILPENLLSVPSIGTICYHPSLLPRHRGASAINWAIMWGDHRTGLTVFWADKEIDTGPILLQKEIDIRPEDTAGSLYFNTLLPMGVEALIEAVELIKQGKAPKIPQDESQATYEPPCDDRSALVDFNRRVQDIFNLIRGCDPHPGAYIDFNGKRIRFYDAGMSLSDTDKEPGEIITVDETGLQIALKGGMIKVGKLRVDRGEKISPEEFSRILGVKRGERLGK